MSSNKIIERGREKWDYNLNRKNRIKNSPQKSRNSSASSINYSVNSKNECSHNEILERNLSFDSQEENILIPNDLAEVYHANEDYNDIKFKKYKIEDSKKDLISEQNNTKSIIEENESKNSRKEKKYYSPRVSSNKDYDSLSNASIDSITLAKRIKLNNTVQKSRKSFQK